MNEESREAIQKAVYRLRLDLVLVEANFWTEHSITEVALADLLEGARTLLDISAVLFRTVHDASCTCTENLRNIHQAYGAVDLIGGAEG